MHREQPSSGRKGHLMKIFRWNSQLHPTCWIRLCSFWSAVRQCVHGGWWSKAGISSTETFVAWQRQNHPNTLEHPSRCLYQPCTDSETCSAVNHAPSGTVRNLMIVLILIIPDEWLLSSIYAKFWEWLSHLTVGVNPLNYHYKQTCVKLCEW